MGDDFSLPTNSSQSTSPLHMFAHVLSRRKKAHRAEQEDPDMFMSLINSTFPAIRRLFSRPSDIVPDLVRLISGIV